jgi:hypothetical protein
VLNIVGETNYKYIGEFGFALALKERNKQKRK